MAEGRAQQSTASTNPESWVINGVASLGIAIKNKSASVALLVRVHGVHDPTADIWAEIAAGDKEYFVAPYISQVDFKTASGTADYAASVVRGQFE